MLPENKTISNHSMVRLAPGLHVVRQEYEICNLAMYQWMECLNNGVTTIYRFTPRSYHRQQGRGDKVGCKYAIVSVVGLGLVLSLIPCDLGNLCHAWHKARCNLYADIFVFYSVHLLFLYLVHLGLCTTLRYLVINCCSTCWLSSSLDLPVQTLWWHDITRLKVIPKLY